MIHWRDWIIEFQILGAGADISTAGFYSQAKKLYFIHVQSLGPFCTGGCRHLFQTKIVCGPQVGQKVNNVLAGYWRHVATAPAYSKTPIVLLEDDFSPLWWSGLLSSASLTKHNSRVFQSKNRHVILTHFSCSS